MKWRHLAAALLLLAGLATLAPATARAEGLDRASIIQELFTLNRRLEESRSALADLEQRLQQVSTRQEEARARYDQLEAQRQARLAEYGKRLRYQRERGRMAPYRLLFGAKSLSDFFGGLGRLQQITAHEARLVRELQELQAAVAVEERTLADVRAEAEQLREQHLAQAAQLEQAIAEREAILAGLGDDRPEVETALAAVEVDWEESAQPVLTALGAALQEISTDEFEPDDIRITFLPPGVVVQISEQRLNDYFHRWAELANLQVDLPGEAFHLTGSFDEVPIRIEGGFRVLLDGRLRFDPTVMQVREFLVPRAVIEQILALEQLDIDVSTVVQPFRLQAIQVSDGMLTIKAGGR